MTVAILPRVNEAWLRRMKTEAPEIRFLRSVKGCTDLDGMKPKS
jgi:hypothetical protein